MKILALNPFATDNYDKAVQSVLEKVRLSDTEIVVDHLSRGLSFIRYKYFKSLITPDIIERIIQAERQGYDGVFVSCCFEPGVTEAREVVDIPVVGGAVPAVFLARQLGQRFGFITDTELANVQTYDVFKQHKLDVECVAIQDVGLGAEEIPLDPKKNFERVIEVAQQMVSNGADVIVLGCTIVAAFFNLTGRELPADLAGIPFLDSNVCSLKMLEMLVDLREKCGVEVSRKAYYAKPQDGEQEAFQRNRRNFGLPNLQKPLSKK